MGLLALGLGFGFLYLKRSALEITKISLWASSALLLLYIGSFHFLPPMLRAILALFIIAVLTGSPKRIPAVWAIFGLSLPILASLQFYAGYPMRWIAAVGAENVLQGLGNEVTRQGTDLWQNGNVVGVDPPCSGIDMLWTGMLITAGYAAWMNWRWLQTSIALVASVGIVIFANSLRVTLLYFKESGMVNLPDWTHEGIGIAIFAIIIGCLRGNHHPLQNKQSKTEFPVINKPLLGFAICAAIAAILPTINFTNAHSRGSMAEFPGWPEKWQDKYLESIPLTQTEQVFSETFPGKLAVFSTGPEKLIYRWVTRPTRQLHSSADCLKASGFKIEKDRGGKFLAVSPEGYWYIVEESVSSIESEDTWSEISQWYWQAVMKRTEGPWMAVTVIRPAYDR